MFIQSALDKRNTQATKKYFTSNKENYDKRNTQATGKYLSSNKENYDKKILEQRENT